jgi:hypothetical protein
MDLDGQYLDGQDFVLAAQHDTIGTAYTDSLSAAY